MVILLADQSLNGFRLFQRNSKGDWDKNDQKHKEEKNEASM